MSARPRTDTEPQLTVVARRGQGCGQDSRVLGKSGLGQKTSTGTASKGTQCDPVHTSLIKPVSFLEAKCLLWGP